VALDGDRLAVFVEIYGSFMDMYGSFVNIYDSLVDFLWKGVVSDGDHTSSFGGYV